MGNQQKMDNHQLQPDAQRVQPPRRRPYRTPRLTVYGDLATITKAKGGTGGDGGGNPRTKK